MLLLQICGILFIFQVRIISTYNGEVYLKRQKREFEQSLVTAFPGTKPQDISESEFESSGMNQLSQFYSSGVGSAEGSGAENGSGIKANLDRNNAEREVDRLENVQQSSGSGMVPDMDSSFAELLGEEEEDKENGESSSGEVAAEKEDNVKGILTAKRNSIPIIRTIGRVSGGIQSREKDNEGKELEINKRSLENEKKMALLEEFFQLMGATEEKKVSKRTADYDDEEQNEMFTASKEFHDDKQGIVMKQNDRKDEILNKQNQGKEAIETEGGRDLRIRKREAEDLGDETLPNLSYRQKEADHSKFVSFDNEKKNVELVKRNVVDGDNAVRFLEEVNTENLFTEHEREMLEQITRGKRTESDDLKESMEGTETKTKMKMNEFPMIRLVMSDMVRPKRESDIVSKNKENKKRLTRDEAVLSKRAVDEDLTQKRELSPSDEPTDQRTGIESVFVSRLRQNVEKRSVLFDNDVNVDKMMANIGRPTASIIQKRYIRNDGPATPVMISDMTTADANEALMPLENEYLQNLKKRGLDENEINPGRNSGASNKDTVNGNGSVMEDDRMLEEVIKKEKFEDNLQKDLKRDTVIGTFAKPTQVAGFWSGLGSKPIFVETDTVERFDDSESGSGLEDEGDGKTKKSVSKKKISFKRKKSSKRFRPEEIGGIMENIGHEEKSSANEKKQVKINVERKNKRKDKERKKRLDKEDESDNENEKKKVAQSVLTFDEMHEVVAKNERSRIKEQKDRFKGDEEVEKDGEGDDADESGDEEESGDEATAEAVRSNQEDDIVVKTLSATYRENNIIDKRNKIVVKRAPNDSGYIGCYVDVLHPMRDLAVRAGIPFVTINNCRSACRRTGYYYAGLQFGYLCFCGNNYGKYDMAPDSECNYACSGDGNQTCGGLWRNSIYFTAGAPEKSSEGPVPFYLPPSERAAISEVNVKRSEIPQPHVGNETYSFNASQAYPVVVNLTNQAMPSRPLQTNQSTAASNSVVTVPSNNANEVLGETATSNKLAEKSDSEMTGVKKPEGKRKVLMHFAYLHPQEHHEIQPTNPPAPTPPLRIEPQTRVFKGEIKLKQKWFDEFKNKMSAKSLILAGNVEQALKNIYANSSNQKDFLKAEVLSFREGIINNNPYTVTRVIVEFTLTFDQGTISPDARLFAKVRSSKKLDEMPVYAKSLKVSEYRFDPNSPNQAFKIPIKEPPSTDVQSENDEDRRKSMIPSPNTQLPMNENLGGDQLMSQIKKELKPNSDGMQELQNYLSSENSLPPAANQQAGMIGAEQTKEQGITLHKETNVDNNELSKRSNVPPMETRQQKVPYILRLFFWKDMLARRKRHSAVEKNSNEILRGKRGDVENDEKIARNSDKDEINTDIKLKKRFENKQTPLTEQSSFERRFMKKTKRRMKDLTTEKELKRSKRLDEFEDFD